jgi:hypothetical protein
VEPGIYIPSYRREYLQGCHVDGLFHPFAKTLRLRRPEQETRQLGLILTSHGLQQMRRDKSSPRKVTSRNSSMNSYQLGSLL